MSRLFDSNIPGRVFFYFILKIKRFKNKKKNFINPRGKMFLLVHAVAQLRNKDKEMRSKKTKYII